MTFDAILSSLSDKHGYAELLVGADGALHPVELVWTVRLAPGEAHADALQRIALQPGDRVQMHHGAGAEYIRITRPAT